jgi:hypothetical protein
MHKIDTKNNYRPLLLLLHNSDNDNDNDIEEEEKEVCPPGL